MTTQTVRSPTAFKPTRASRELAAYFALTFGLTWGVAALFLLFRTRLEAVFGALSMTNPLFWLAVFAPNIAALALTARQEGWAGLERLLSGVLRWRVAVGWYALVLLLVPALGVLGALLGGSREALRGGVPGFLALVAMHVTSDPGPFGEELGWRGYALPRLLEGRSALAASLILGAVWGVWHLPAFLIGGTPQAGLAVAVPFFVVGTCVYSVIVTWVYVNTRSLLLCAMLHSTINMMGMIGAPFPVSIGLLAAVAVVAVLTNGPRLSRR